MRGMLLLLCALLSGCYQIAPVNERTLYRLNTITGQIHVCANFTFNPGKVVCNDEAARK